MEHLRGAQGAGGNLEPSWGRLGRGRGYLQHPTRRKKGVCVDYGVVRRISVRTRSFLWPGFRKLSTRSFSLHSFEHLIFRRVTFQ